MKPPLTTTPLKFLTLFLFLLPRARFPCLPNPVCNSAPQSSDLNHEERLKITNTFLLFKFLEKKKTYWHTNLFFLCRHHHNQHCTKSNQNTPRNIFGTFLVFIYSKKNYLEVETVFLVLQPIMTEPKPEFGLRSKNPEKTLTKGLKMREIRLGEAVVVVVVVRLVVTIVETVVVEVCLVVNAVRPKKEHFPYFDSPV